jgi:hypothetical protein
MSEINIIIPSAGRAKQVLTNIESQILCVPEAELEQYRKYNDFEIIVHPDFINLAQKRNWIYKKFGDVFMADDDIITIERVYIHKNAILDPLEARNIIQNLYNLAKDIDAKIFGFCEDPNPNHYNPYKPLMLKGYINGCAIGMLKDEKLYFTEKTTAAESHWINLLNMYYNRYNLIDTRFHFRQKANSTFLGSGGQAARRTMASEARDTLFLRQTFGESVVLRRKKKNAKQLHAYQRSIKTPW